MPKKCLKLAKGVRSVPQIGSRYDGHRDSQSSSSSSMSTRSSSSTIKQLKTAQMAEKKAMEEASRSEGEPTKQVQPHFVSHMLPYFYPNDYDPDQTDNDTGMEVPRHLVSNVTAYCYPVTGTTDNEDTHSPRPNIVPPHLESHVALYCQPVNVNGEIIEDSTIPKVDKPRRTNYVPRHLQSQVFDNKREAEERRTGICCEMTRDHANMRDNVFAADDDKPFRRVGGRRPVANQRNLFEESMPKPRPMSITIVQRAPENTKENIFGSKTSVPSRGRRRWENDSKQAIFGCDTDADQASTSTPTPRSRGRENTKEKLFGETYGIKEAEEEHARRRRTLREEDTQMTLFGPPSTPTPQRPLSTQSFTSTYDNLFGQPPPPQTSRRMRRENTFDNLFGGTAARPVTAIGTDARYTPKNPKLLQVTSS